MFEDGLHNRVDIFKLNRNMSNRMEKDKTKVSNAPDIINVSCRIIKNEKVLFAGRLHLEDGDTIKDYGSGIVYEIRSGNRINGMGGTHHSSYDIRIKSESDRHG